MGCLASPSWRTAEMSRKSSLAYETSPIWTQSLLRSFTKTRRHLEVTQDHTTLLETLDLLPGPRPEA